MKLSNAVPDRRIRQLYKQAFPAAERAPFFLLKRRAAQGRADCWSLTEGSQWVGMAYVLRRQDLAYLFYFAIDGSSRGQGYGTKAIEALLEQYAGCRFFLALETLDEHAENYADRLRRHCFYLRRGLTDRPYRIKEASVTYDMMGTGGSVAPEEYKSLVDAWLGRPWKWLIDTGMTAKG